MGYSSPLRATVSHLAEQPAAWDDTVVAGLARVTRERAKAYLGQLVADQVLALRRETYQKGITFPRWRDAEPRARPRHGRWQWAASDDRGARLRLAKALIAARAAAGLSITRLAWASKVNRKTIIRLEHAQFDATQRTRDRLSAALGVRL